MIKKTNLSLKSNAINKTEITNTKSQEYLHIHIFVQIKDSNVFIVFIGFAILEKVYLTTCLTTPCTR